MARKFLAYTVVDTKHLVLVSHEVLSEGKRKRLILLTACLTNEISTKGFESLCQTVFNKTPLFSIQSFY